MAQHGASHHFISTVDDVAWLTNLRGADVNYNPVFLAHLLVDLRGATLFIGTGKVDAALQQRLRADGVALADYAAAPAALQSLPPRQHAADRPEAHHAGPARTGRGTTPASSRPSTPARC